LRAMASKRAARICNWSWSDIPTHRTGLDSNIQSLEKVAKK
jgi:hypothetical protein